MSVLTVSAARVLRTHLINLGAGVYPPAAAGQWLIVTDGMPLNPDDVISITDTGAIQATQDFRSADRVEWNTVQVMIRAGTYESTGGFSKGREVEAVLHAIGVPDGQGTRYFPMVNVDGTDFVITKGTVTVSTMKISTEEKNRRDVYVMNARMQIEVLTWPA